MSPNAKTTEEQPPEIPDYELVRKIGGGSYGEVWLARNMFGVYRAIKVVRRSSFDSERPYQREFNGIQKFEPISRSHPAFVAILHVGQNQARGYFYYVMELGDDQQSGQQIIPEHYQAKTLATDIKTQVRLPLPECIRIGLSISDALASLHKAELVHRDIKPSNIIFVNGNPKLADIGLVDSIASAGTFVGTQGYIPPEGPGTIQADIYALGKLLYEISTGNDRQQFPELPDFVAELESADLFREFNEVLIRACEGNLQGRYTSAEQLHADLELVDSGRSLRRLRALERRWRVATRATAIGGLGLLVAGGIAWTMVRQQQRTAEARASRTAIALTYGGRMIMDAKQFSAVPWFIDASENDDRGEEKTHRARIAALLQYAPQLKRCLWRSGDVLSLDWSPNGDYVAVGESTGTVTLLNATNGTVISSATHGANRRVTSVKFSGDGKLLVSASGTSTAVLIWSVPELQARGRLVAGTKEEGTNAVSYAEFSPDGSHVIGSGGNAATEWNLESAKVVRRYYGHLDWVRVACYSPDGTRVATASNDKTAIIFDRMSAKPIFSIPHEQWVMDVSFSPDGKWIATGCFDNYARVWNATNGEMRLHPLQHDAAARSTRFSSDGKYLGVATYFGTVQLWDLDAEGMKLPELKHGEACWTAVFSPDARFVLTGSQDKSLRWWEIAPAIMTPPSSKDRYFAPDGERYFRIADDQTTVTGYRTDNEDIIFRGKAEYPIKEVFSSRRGSKIIFVPRTSRDKLAGYDLAAQKPFTLPSTNFAAGRIWLSDGSSAAFAVTGGSVLKAWDLHTGGNLWLYNATQDLSGATNVAITATLSPNSNWAVLLFADKAVLIDVAAGPAKRRLLQHRMQVACANFSSDGRYVIIGCSDSSLSPGYAQVWDTRTGKAAGPALHHRDGVIAVALSADGKRCATGGEDFIARVWDVATGRASLPLQHAGQVYTVSFAEGSKWLVTTSGAEKINVWDVDSAAPVIPALSHSYPLIDAQISSDGRRLIARANPSWSRIYQLPEIESITPELKKVAAFLSGELPPTVAERELATATLHSIYASSAPRSDGEWHSDQALHCAVQKNYAGARLHYEAAIRHGLGTPATFAELAHACANSGAVPEAIAHFRRAYELGKQDTAILSRIALLELVRNNTEGYADTLRTLLMCGSEHGWSSVDDLWSVALRPDLVDKSARDRIRRELSRTKEVEGLHALLLSQFEEQSDAVINGLATVKADNRQKGPEYHLVRAVIAAHSSDAAEAEESIQHARQIVVETQNWERQVRLALLRQLAQEALKKSRATAE